jgi:hypothetical protein
LVIVAAGFLSGVVVGGFAVTKRELLARGFELKPVDPFKKLSPLSFVTTILTGSVKIILIGAATVLITVGILHMADLHSLGEGKAYFALSFLAGAVSGKYARYLYWKWRAR